MESGCRTVRVTVERSPVSSVVTDVLQRVVTLDDSAALITLLLSMFGKETVEILELFPIKMSAVFVKDPELEIDILSAELTAVLEIPV